MIDRARDTVSSLTRLGVALLALAIILSLLVGSTHMAFFGNVVDNITGLVDTLGRAGLPGLIALGVVIWLVK